MNQKIQIAIIVILIVIMYIQPSILGNFANCCLGKAILLGAVIYLTLHNTSMGLLAAIILISSIYVVDREGLTNSNDDIAQKAANAALDVIGIDTDFSTNVDDEPKNKVRNGTIKSKIQDIKENKTKIDTDTDTPPTDDDDITPPTDDDIPPTDDDDIPPTDDDDSLNTLSGVPTPTTETFRNREGFNIMSGVDLITIENQLQSRDSASLPILNGSTKNWLPKENSLDNLILFSKGPLPLLS
jgi:hypothetical protein